MQRFGQVLRVREGKEIAYEVAHEMVDPENIEAIQKAGIRNFSIYRYGHWLFSYFELPDDITLENAYKSMDGVEAVLKWEELMHELQEPLPESGDINWWVPMKEIWHEDGV